MSVELRAATIADLDAMVALDHEMFPLDHWSASGMRDEIRSEHTHYVVLERDGELVGAAGILAAQGAGEADVQTIAVRSELRRGGWGTRLLRELLA